MTHSVPARTSARWTRSLTYPPGYDYRGAPGEAGIAGPPMGLTVYGCSPEEADLFREMAPRFGVSPTITEAAVSEANTSLALGNRCVSISHKANVTDATLLALHESGVRYVFTRSVGCNHIDVGYAESLGITVGKVTYSPDSVADFTLMLMLMLVRNAKSVIRRADLHDYRLPDRRGKELRDMTAGVIGTGRIGAAVIERLGGFGCRVLASDPTPRLPADYVSIEELLRQSDLVTLHTPLKCATHHLLSRERIGQMREGAFLVNTGRGALVDTEALVRTLESGRLAGVALDVLEGEEGVFYADCRGKPIENDWLLRLHEMPNVLITPHVAYDTDHAVRDMVESSIMNCLAFEGGQA